MDRPNVLFLHKKAIWNIHPKIIQLKICAAGWQTSSYRKRKQIRNSIRQTRNFRIRKRSITKQEKLLSEKFQDSDKKVKELANLFTTHWGKLVEALVEPSCLSLFQERDVLTEQSYQNVKAKHAGKNMECDVLLVNDTELVVIEVKNTCRPEYIDDLKEKLKEFQAFFPQYKNYSPYGALAALKYDGASDKYAYRNGFFVIKATEGDGLIKIVKDHDFKPEVY